jgi:hypothetical protein
MARDSNGTYTAPTNSWNPATEGSVIDETDWNAILDDVETALTDSLSISGKGKVTAHIDFDENGSPGTPATNVGRLYASDVGGATSLFWKDAAGNAYNLLLSSPGLAFAFDTSTTTSSDPGAGKVRFNNATLASVTEIAIDDADATGNDIATFVQNISANSYLIFSKRTGAGIAIFQATSVTDDTGFNKLAVTYIDHSGSFASADPLSLSVGPAGPAGAAGSTGLDWDGAWQTATAYVINDAVSNNGASYICILGHTSGASSEPGVGGDTATYWNVLAAAGADGAGTGDVTAASNFGTDNRVIRSDGTTKGVQSTGITVDDSDNVSGVATLTLPNTGLHLLDTNATHDLIIAPGSNLTADRTLTVTTGDSDRTLTVSGNATVSQDYSTTGNPQFATIELGAATDTTISRASAGVVSVEGIQLLKANGNQTITAGFAVTPYSIGTVSSGTTTPAAANGNYQYYTNNGAHTLAAPSSDCAIDILVTNGASAGAITFSGFTVGSSTGSTLTTTNTNKFIISIRRINSVATYSIYALQ